MKVTKICKADPITENEIDGQTICITDKIPGGMTLETAQLFYEKQAHLIEEVLFGTLPQGTYDCLGIMFMKRKVSLYRGRTE